MNFVELFAELAPYMPSPKRRFGLVTRIKRGLLDQSLPGGSGKAQVYFEGALTILRRDFDTDDLRLLYAGRLMLSEMDRVRRLAHTSFITLPGFAADLQAYRKDLRAMALLNGLVEPAVRKPAVKAAASVALAVAPPPTVSVTPPPRVKSPPTASPKRAKGAAAEALATSKLFHKFLAAKKRKKKASPRKAAKPAKASPPTPPAAATPKNRGDRKPKPAAAPPPPRAPRLPAVASPTPRPAPARAAKAPPKLPTTPTTPPPPRITTDHWSKAQRLHAKHQARQVAVLATTVVELTLP